MGIMHYYVPSFVGKQNVESMKFIMHGSRHIFIAKCGISNTNAWMSLFIYFRLLFMFNLRFKNVFGFYTTVNQKYRCGSVKQAYLPIYKFWNSFFA